ncbi:MAG: DNA polymerase-3 subunit delta' [Halieaceae bacterium]|jgi:DNA polymerase-3 subunit delta'
MMPPVNKAKDAELVEAGPGYVVPLPWHGNVWRKLVKQSSENRLPHALLFSGEPGIGKAHLALAFAQYLLCSEPVSSIACGACKSCTLCAAGTHPDLQDIKPPPKKAIIGVDQIRSLLDFTVRTAQQGGARVVVIRPANALNLNSANSLLKCLEEPGEDTYLILVSDRDQAMPATIRSRCQRIPIANADRAQALAWLTPQLGAESVDRLLDLSCNRPLSALAMVESGQLALEEALQLSMRSLANTGGASALDMVSAFKAMPLAVVLERMASFVHETVRNQSSQIDSEAECMAGLIEFYDELLNLHKAVSRAGNPNVALTMDYLFTRLKEVLGQ